MDNINAIETIRERDIDLLIMEEVFSSELFRNNLLNKFYLKAKNYTFWGCWHSIMDNELGETDVLVGFKDSNDKRIVIMLENKIDVSFQPMQPERYLKRGKKGISDGLWDEFYLCLTAPQAYINNVNKKEFKYFLPYEEILELIKQNDLEENRTSFKLYMLETAIDKKKRGYSFSIDEDVTKFWQDYYKIIESNYPNLKSRTPSAKPNKADWYHFRSPILNSPFSIIHKWQVGYVDLQIAGIVEKLDILENTLALPEDAELVKTGKSLSIRKVCPELNRFKPLEEQYQKVIDGLNKVEELVKFYENNKETILI